MTIDVSIIIPVYNPIIEEFRLALASAFNQSFLSENYEIIIIDDGNDDAAEIENVLAEFADSKVKTTLHHHPKNRGLAAARETGAAKARGEFVTFLDADDYLTADALELMFNTTKKEQADMVVGEVMEGVFGIQMWPYASKLYAHSSNLKNRAIALYSWSSISMWGALFARENLLQHLACPEHLLHEDITTLPRIAMAAKKIVSLNQFIYFYRLGSTQTITGSIGKNHVESMVFNFHSHASLLEKYNLLQNSKIIAASEYFYQKFIAVILVRGCLLDIKDFADRKSLIQFAVKEFTPFLDEFEKPSTDLQNLKKLFLQLSQATSDEQVITLIKKFSPHSWEYFQKRMHTYASSSRHHDNLVISTQPKDLRAFETAMLGTQKIGHKLIYSKIILSPKFILFVERFIRKLPIPYLYKIALWCYRKIKK